MAGSTFGTLFRVTTWGESHGAGVGCVIDGCPAGLTLSEEDIQKYLDRRKPGQSRYTTSRSEADRVRILSGVFGGKTEGTPVSLLVENTNQHSGDYSNLKDVYRPGHADFGFDAKYGFRDYRGGGRSSGRETVARVAAGAVAARALDSLGISLLAYVRSIGPAVCDPARYDFDRLSGSRLQMPDEEAEKKAQEYLDACIKNQDSLGGVVECRVRGLMPGRGEPVFDKLDALLAQALMSVGAVKAVEVGDGTLAAAVSGSDNNDQYAEENGAVHKTSNHAGGIMGGMSDGNELVVRAHFKPTPSISRQQQALGSDGHVHELIIKGRHDPVIVPRAAVVVECMTAVTIFDLLLRNMTAKMDNLRKLYR